MADEVFDDDFKPRSQGRERRWPLLGKPLRRKEKKKNPTTTTTTTTFSGAGACASAQVDDVVEEAWDGRKENVCPVCRTDLNAVSETLRGQSAHVNACLDKISASGAPSNPSLNPGGGLRDMTNDCDVRKDSVGVVGSNGHQVTPSFSHALRMAARMTGGEGSAPTQGKSTKLPPSTKAKGSYWNKWQSHVITGTPGPFAVDCFSGRQSTAMFQRGTTSWFLSHFHYDHYIGLNKSFNKGQIYCTKITAKLVHHILNVPLEVLHILPLNTPVAIQGVKVTALDANHCPGACMFLFEPAGEIPTLHTGDCRLVGEKMRSMQALSKVRGKVHLILDTTYCQPKYTFPSQEQVVDAIVKVILAEVASNPKVLVLVGTYTIGKEVVFFRIAEALGRKVYIGANKRRVVKCLELDSRRSALVTPNDMETNVHAVPLGYTRSQQRMEGILKHYKNKFTGIVAVCPTGWSQDKLSGRGPSAGRSRHPAASNNFVSCRKKGKVVTYSVPYSEHSSYDEMRTFVSWLQPADIVPFVKLQDQEAFHSLVQLACQR